MNVEPLVHDLADAIVKFLESQSSSNQDQAGASRLSPRTERGKATGSARTQPVEKAGSGDLLSYATRIAERLIDEAYSNGWGGGVKFKVDYQQAAEGSTANVVAFARPTISCVIKIDNDEKLLREALNIRGIAQRRDLPSDFTTLFPRVYAIKEDEPPFAYLMEHFQDYASYSSLFYEQEVSDRDVVRVADSILDAILRAFSQSRNENLKPNIGHLYLGRIKERLNAARSLSTEFRDLSVGAVTVNGREYAPLDSYYDEVMKHLTSLEVGFTTYVHGDVHPENVLVRFDATGGIESLKFIDPKDWREGDYIFDIGKLCHYMAVTAAAEHKRTPPSIIWNSDERRLNYELPVIRY